MFKSGLTDLEYEIEKMPEDEKRIEEPFRVIDIVEKILNANNQEGKGQGLKILTPDQMLSRLPIALAQLKAVNNSKKLKNKIRQLLLPFLKMKTIFMNTGNNLI